MNLPPLKSMTALGLWVVVSLLWPACPVWRTEHKVETTHKIEAHIVIDIRKISAEAQAVEQEVRNEDETVEQAPKAEPDDAGLRSTWVGHDPPRQVASRSIWSIFDFATTASAQTPDDKRAAIARRKSRAGRIGKLLGQGCLGENNKGYVEARPCDASKSAKKAAKALAAEENKDRKIVYRAVAVEQGLKADQAGIIGTIFAVQIANELKSGQAFQVPSNAERLKDFRATKLGRKLPDAKKGKWVKVP